MSATFERVYTIHEWYDGPRAGFADFEGTPHVYRCLFDSHADDWSPDYHLAPVDAATLGAALEDWAIFRRWEAAYRSGAASAESRPALPSDQARYSELAQVLRPVLDKPSPHAILARPEFRPQPGARPAEGELLPFEVRWTRSATGQAASDP